MLLFVFVAIAGGLVTGAAMAPFGWVTALLSAPLGGSLCAAAAALVVMQFRGPTYQSEEDLEAQTDAMVADLRGIAAEAKRLETSQSESRQDGRRIA